MTAIVLAPYEKPAVSVPPFPYYKSSIYLAPSEYNTAAKVQAIADGQMTSNINGDTITLDTGSTKYGYLFSPVSNGTIVFMDMSINTNGGWDGASWPSNGDIGVSYGPTIVSLDFGAGAEDWYVYRTDFVGVGLKTWKLTYSRAQ